MCWDQTCRKRTVKKNENREIERQEEECKEHYYLLIVALKMGNEEEVEEKAKWQTVQHTLD